MASVKVAVRVRPFNSREKAMKSKLIVRMAGKQTHLQKRLRASTTGAVRAIGDATRKATNNEDGNQSADGYDFTYDHSYWSFDVHDPTFVAQQQVYEDLGRDVIECAFQGYNACVFAYGQTGSGKTYTMMGSASDPGLIPRTCEALFERIRCGQESPGTAYKTTVSYLEIYNERVMDLLDDANRGHTLKVREHQSSGPYVEDLSQHTVMCYSEIQEFINKGNRLRTTASTNMNETSSRSHAIFTIKFTQARFVNEMPSETASKIHLVDLAGSESAATTGASGARLKEGAHINQSLVTLGIVIKTLAEQSSGSSKRGGADAYIPYRNSTLTRILKDSLGGNSKTIMIATISPADINCTETLSTLRYANRAKNIINTPTVNEDTNVKLIRDLRDEIQKLKALLIGEASQSKPSAKVFADLKRIEQQEKELTSEWTEKWSEIHAILHEQKALGLRKYGTGVMLESKVPHLIGIHDDTRTGVTLYSLREGRTLIGNGSHQAEDSPVGSAGNCLMIPLTGNDILPEHCVIRLETGVATIEPLDNASCVLNGTPVVHATPIFQGDFLLLGQTNMFRYNNPAEEASARPARVIKDTHRSMLNLSQSSLMTRSQTTLGNSMFGFSDDEISFVWPLASERFADHDNATIVHPQSDSPYQVKSLTPYDLNNLKQMNMREHDLLTRKELHMQEKLKLEEEINFETIQMCSIGADLDRAIKQHMAIDAADDDANKRICDLEDQLLRSEQRLHDHSNSLGNLNDMIQSLEINHCLLIRTRRKFEDEALNMSRFNGSIFHGKNSTQLAAITLTTSTSTDTSSSDNTPSTDDQSTAAAQDAVNGNQSPPPPSNNNNDDDDDLPTCCAMQALRQSIAFEKAKLMRNVEVNSDKSVLDAGIDRLHALQRQYFALEKQIEYQGSHHDGGGGGSVCQCNREHDVPLACAASDKSAVTSMTTSRSNSIGSGEYAISIPRYAVRGSGSSSMHYEYEITINLEADQWSIMRRYSRFRELHLTMRRRYGDAVAQIRFPRRQFFFAQTESVATRRRHLLEVYLRRLLVVCSKIPGCPLYEDDTLPFLGGRGGLRKAALIEFSSFFLRGICECEYRSETEESLS